MRSIAGVIPESRVVEIWQDCLAGRTDLVTEEEGPVEVVYPGRPNDDRGADLKDCVITVGRRLRRGDVEVHVRSSSWWGHGHHQDPVYNRVILHVVYQRDTDRAVVRQDGHTVPTLTLGRYVAGGAGPRAAVYPFNRRLLPCRAVAGRRSDEFLGGVLDSAGDLRFTARVAGFRAALSRLVPAQALYEGILEALGYVKNKMPMLELAGRLPFARLAGAAPSGVPDEECLARYQALLLGTAGLLPPGDEAWAARLKCTWESSGAGETMSAGDWRSFKVRPGNLPRRRLAAMSYLLLRYRDEGLLAGLVRALENAGTDTGKRGLENSLLVAASDYWAANLDFGLPARHTAPSLLGEDRVGAIVINVLLPFAAAWGSTALMEKAPEIYHSYPALAENAPERHVRRQLGVSRLTVNSARRQQGLLHIYKTYCAQGKCVACPLGG